MNGKNTNEYVNKYTNDDELTLAMYSINIFIGFVSRTFKFPIVIVLNS